MKVDAMPSTPKQEDLSCSTDRRTDERARSQVWASPSPSFAVEPRTVRAESSHHTLPPQAGLSAGALHQPLSVAGRSSGPSTLLRLNVERGQSPWLDHLTRGSL